MNEIATGLVVVAVASIVALFRHQIVRMWRKRRPVEFSVLQIIEEPWSVAFAGEMPDASEIEGVEHNGRKVYDWLREHGAVDFCETRLRLTVRGLAEDTVLIRNIRAEVKHSLPFSGACVHCPTAGVNKATLLVFDLDEQNPVGWEWREEGARERIGGLPFFELNNVTLSRGEVHEFIIIGCAKKSLARWRLYLDLEIRKYRKSLPLCYANKPFETSGMPTSGFGTNLEWAWYDGARFLPPPQIE